MSTTKFKKLTFNKREQCRLLIDTDCGFDDIVAIHCLWNKIMRNSCSKQTASVPTTKTTIDLITTTCGVSSSLIAAETLRWTFDAATATNNDNTNEAMAIQVAPSPNVVDREELPWIPIFRQKLETFRQSLAKAESDNQNNDSTKILPPKPPPPPTTAIPAATAFDAAMELFQNSADESVDILCLGPLSNLAAWLEHDHDLVTSKIRTVWISGGNRPIPTMNCDRHENDTDITTTIANHAEFNFMQDPSAVAKVFLKSPGLITKIVVVPGIEAGYTKTSKAYTESILSTISKQKDNDDNSNYNSNRAGDDEKTKPILHRALLANPNYSIYYDPVCCFLYHQHRNQLLLEGQMDENRTRKEEQEVLEETSAEFDIVPVTGVDPKTGVLLTITNNDSGGKFPNDDHHHHHHHNFANNISFENYKTWILHAISEA